MATGTLKMIPPVGFEPTTSHIASGAVQEVEGPRAGRVRLVASCQGSQRRTFSFLGRGGTCSRSGPTIVAPHSFLSGPNSRPMAARTLSHDG
jgi:hypothetical protein